MGLKVDPTCRMARVARLNSLAEKSYPPTSARIFPVLFSRMTRAPSTSGR